jgi:nucleotide-binding universal stress UspA family protein
MQPEKIMFTKILLPLDGSSTAERALPFARLLASTMKIPLELLEVVDVSAASAHLAAEKARYLDALIAEGERVSMEHLKDVAAGLPGLKVSCTVERGNPADVIIERAAQDKHTLIAMATHGRSGVARWMMGSVAEKVLRGSTNPLFLVRADEDAKTDGPTTMKSVIVPLDGSKLAESALPTVVEVAKPLQLEVVLCRAYELPPSAYYGREGDLPDYDRMLSEFKTEVEDYLAKKTESLKLAGLAKVSWVALQGSSAEEIIGYARNHPDGLIAMCTHGRSGVSRWVLGSVTEKVVRHSGEPVLVVHGT